MAQLFDINNKKLVTNRIGRQYWIWNNDKLYEQRMARENGPYQARNLVMNRRLLPTARTTELEPVAPLLAIVVGPRMLGVMPLVK